MLSFALAFRKPLAVAALLLLGLQTAPVQAQATKQLTATKVVSAFRAAGLPVNNLHQESLYGGPSGPPATEKEVWRFSIPEVAPSGGKIMIFSNNARRDAKAFWFKQVHVNVAVYKNVILWLDNRLSASRVAAYRHALMGL
jgi:hypothetical protein